MARRVPLISMAKFRATNGQDPDFIAELGRACEDIGFAVLVDHGFEYTLFEDAHTALIRKLFALPRETLDTYVTPHLRSGYGAFNALRGGDPMHFWHVRREGSVGPANVWPTELPELRAHALGLYNKLDEFGQLILVALERHLGVNEGAIAKMHVGGDSTLRFMHYPAITAERAEENGPRCSEHSDLTFITLLYAATARGLQVKDRDGSWHHVEETPRSIVLNMGDMIESYTKGRVVSTPHRVVNPPGGDLSERFSNPFFIQPRPDAIINDEGTTAEEFMLSYLRRHGIIDT